MEILPGLIDSAAIVRTHGSTDAIHREFRAGRLVRIRRGFYVRTVDWLRARPSERFAWSTAAVARSVKDAVLCGETAAVAIGLPTLRTPPCVELATTLSGRSGVRRSPLMVLGEDDAARQVRAKRSYPLRYCLKPGIKPEAHGEFRCTSPVQTILDLMVTGKLSEALVVADGLAARLHRQGMLSAGSDLLAVSEIVDGISAHPHASAQRRAARVAALASPLAESVGESYSRAAFELLGFDQPVLQHVSMTGTALSAGWTAGGRNSALWVNSMGRRSTLRRPSVVTRRRRRLCTVKSFVRTGSGGSASASCGGVGRMWKTRNG
ncbi:Transcriptional regulator, AbiEi antitoxin, Type IV TA system [Arthrobacter sp. P2b]|nr:Transcriptional regulator, AbiEi antitoxin, Type IV TA system [Arthrobacter sp. P2b]